MPIRSPMLVLALGLLFAACDSTTDPASPFDQDIPAHADDIRVGDGAISRDGRHLAFTRSPAGTGQVTDFDQVWVLDLQKRQQRQVMGGRASVLD